MKYSSVQVYTLGDAKGLSIFENLKNRHCRASATEFLGDVLTRADSFSGQNKTKQATIATTLITVMSHSYWLDHGEFQ